MCAPETTGVKHLYISKYYFVIFPLGSWKSYFQFSILLEEVNLNNIAVPSARSARPSYARAPSNVAANNANNANNRKSPEWCLRKYNIPGSRTKNRSAKYTRFAKIYTDWLWDIVKIGKEYSKQIYCNAPNLLMKRCVIILNISH